MYALKYIMLYHVWKWYASKAPNIYKKIFKEFKNIYEKYINYVLMRLF